MKTALEICEEGVAAQSILKSGNKYITHINFGDFVNAGVSWQPLFAQRAINMSVVRERIAANSQLYKTQKKLYDFGCMNFVIVEKEKSNVIYVMDGQHRVHTMYGLVTEFPDVSIVFQGVITVVADEQQAYESFIHFNNIHPVDSRAIFRTQEERWLCENTLERFSKTYPTMLSNRKNDPPRPYLNDYILYWIIKEFNLIRLCETGDTNSNPFDDDSPSEKLWRQLLELDKRVTKYIEDHDDSVSLSMIKKCHQNKMYLGLLRENKLTKEHIM